MSQRQPSVITIDPPLPCGMVKATGICGQPTGKGHIRALNEATGQWVITPICQDCSLAAMDVLWDAGQEQAAAANLEQGNQPTPAPAPGAAFASHLNRKSNKKRYAAQFLTLETDQFEDFGYWATAKQAAGHVLMTISSNAQVKAGRVFDQVEQRVVGEVRYRA